MTPCPACGRHEVTAVRVNELVCTNADCPNPTAVNAHLEVTVRVITADGTQQVYEFPRLVNDSLAFATGRLWLTGMVAAVPDGPTVQEGTDGPQT